MVKEAEANATEDKKKKEEAETKNNAESMISAADRIVKDFEGKISDSDKTKLEEQKTALRKALDENKAHEEIKKLSEDLQQTMYAISQAAYAQVQKEGQDAQNADGAQEGSSNEQNSSNNNDDVIDAEYTKE